MSRSSTQHHLKSWIREQRWVSLFNITLSVCDWNVAMYWPLIDLPLPLGSDWYQPAVAESSSCNSGASRGCQVACETGYHWVYATPCRTTGKGKLMVLRMSSVFTSLPHVCLPFLPSFLCSLVHSLLSLIFSLSSLILSSSISPSLSLFPYPLLSSSPPSVM